MTGQIEFVEIHFALVRLNGLEKICFMANKSRWQIGRKFIGFLAICFLLWIFLRYFVFPHAVGGGPAEIPRARVNEAQLALGIKNYKQTFGSYPSGENSNIVNALTGNNPLRIVFLNYRRSMEHPNEMVDPWGTPYKIEFLMQTNFTIRSAGKDGIFGNADDIILNGASNDLVKSQN